MRYHNITKDDMLNGDGLRVVLWVAGCNHCCKGCQNPVTWDAAGGLPFDEAAKAEIFEQLDKNYISGITFSGGDPLHPANRVDVRNLAMEIKEKYPLVTSETDSQKWFVPSKAEWAAFGDYLYTKLGVTIGNYGLAACYWSSSQHLSWTAHDTNFFAGGMSSSNIISGDSVRLSATF